MVMRPFGSLVIAGAALAAGCNSFEPEEIVIDTRVLAMSATVPDQVIDIDLSGGQPDPVDLLDQMVPTTMCALIGDPGVTRRIHYKMTLCQPCSDGCCGGAQVPLADGFIEDPDITIPEPSLCTTVEPDGNLLGVVLQTLMDDSFGGLGGVDYAVELRASGEGDDVEQVALKTLRVIPRIPADRTANKNPTIDHVDAALYMPNGDRADPVTLPLGRCVEQTDPIVLAPTQRVRLDPIEADDTRETYVLPTIDGKSQTFTEAPTYQWLATAGGFSAGETGGPREISGTPAPLFTDYRAPPADELDGPTDISLWILQRDERLGSTWYESCIRVVP